MSDTTAVMTLIAHERVGCSDPTLVQTRDGSGRLVAIEIDRDGSFWAHVRLRDETVAYAYPMGEIRAVLSEEGDARCR